MNPLVRLSTPVAAATFAVVGITGTMMFFHVAQHEVEDLHAWFGLTMATALVLHLVRNWAQLKLYPKKGKALQVALVLAGLGAAGFLGAGMIEGEEEGGGRGGMTAAMQALEASPLTELAPVFDTTPEALVTKLTAAGLKGVTADATPATIAAASGGEGRAVIDAIVRP